MLHRPKILPSSLPPHASPKPAAAACCFLGESPALPSYAHHRSSLDGRMEALKGGSRQEETAEEVVVAAAAIDEAPSSWGLVERDQGFSVEDLLNLEEFCQAGEDGDDEEPAAADPESSVVPYELLPHQPPAPEIVGLPAHDVEELEWMSRIMDDSLSELPPPQPPAPVMAPQPQRRRPHDGAPSTEVAVKAKRSKRSRASGWSLSGSGPLSDSASSSPTTTASSCSSSASFSPYFLLGEPDLLEDYHHLFPPPPPPSKKPPPKHTAKKRGRKPRQHLPPPRPAAAAPGGDRCCSHCGVHKTPQWRAGPEGAKTLCNACGVRYKSGRLLPEYRPACSPTFVSEVHSSSHRKVLEMRRKKEDEPLSAAAPAVASF